MTMVSPDWPEIVRQLQEQNAALHAAVAEQNARLAGNDEFARSWLQMKCARQRRALDRLNRKVLTQRFRLRLLADLGRDVTVEEYVAARDAAGNSRLDEYELLGD